MGVINELVKAAHENAKAKGWWDEERTFGEQIALMHSELSEALEEYRAGNKPNEIYVICTCDGGGKVPSCRNCKKTEGIPIELADVIIRIFDTCGRYGIDLEEAINIKMAYNRTRPHKHGGKVI